MRITFTSIVDAGATALLVYTAILQVHGAFRGDAVFVSAAVAALCVLFSVAIWKGTNRIKRWAGTFLVFLGIAVGLSAWRFHFLLPFGWALVTAHLALGILMIGMSKAKREQQGH